MDTQLKGGSRTTTQKASSPMSFSRRNFVKGSMFTGAALALSPILSACSNEASKPDGKKKKVLRFGQANAKLGLDMHKSTNSTSSSVAQCITEGLMKFDQENKVHPCLLAEEPALQADGVTYKCMLKSGVKFHDGTPLKASDVKFTFERMFTPATKAKSTYMYDFIKGAKDMLSGKAKTLAGLTVQDDTHFSFVLDKPFAPFPKNLAISYAYIFPEKACKAAGDKWGHGTNFVGTGPYKIKSNDDTNTVILEGFKDYHDKKAPVLDRVEIHYIDDPNTKLLSFKNGDIDFCDLPATLLKQYKADPQVKPLINSYKPLGTYFINLNLKHEALKDVRVRKALSLGINRQELIDTVLAGAGRVASGWLNPAIPGFDKNAPAFEYNPQKAKQLLQEAGKSALTLTCVTRQANDKVMIAIQNYWKKIGVNLALRQEDAGVWSSDWTAGNLELTELGWFPLYPDGDQHLYTYFYSPNAAKKSSFYNNPTFDGYVSSARTEKDPNKRAELYRKADDLLTRQDYGTLPLYYPIFQSVAKDYVKNTKVGNLVYDLTFVDIDTTKKDYKG